MRENKNIPLEIREALLRYEILREDVYKELEIKYCQSLITKKLLNQTNEEVEIIFYEEEHEQSAEALISEIDCEMNSVESSVKNEKVDSADNNTEEQTLKNDIINYSSQDSEQLNKKLTKNYNSKYLDLDAEVSWEEENDESQDSEDLKSFLDDSVENNINLDKYAKELATRNKESIKAIKEKFFKRNNRQRKVFCEQNEMINLIEDSNEGFPEIPEFQLNEINQDNAISEIKDPTVSQIRNNTKMAVVNIQHEFKNDDLFLNDNTALEKFTKKAESKFILFKTKDEKYP